VETRPVFGLLSVLTSSIILSIASGFNNRIAGRKFLGKMVAFDAFFPVEPFSMDFATRSGEGREPNEEAMVERLRQFVEKSDLSFYRIASRIGTSGGTLSMWLAGKAKPRADELAAIEKLLKG
jgi:hypothetical protein